MGGGLCIIQCELVGVPAGRNDLCSFVESGQLRFIKNIELLTDAEGTILRGVGICFSLFYDCPFDVIADVRFFQGPDMLTQLCAVSFVGVVEA